MIICQGPWFSLKAVRADKNKYMHNPQIKRKTTAVQSMESSDAHIQPIKYKGLKNQPELKFLRATNITQPIVTSTLPDACERWNRSVIQTHQSGVTNTNVDAKLGSSRMYCISAPAKLAERQYMTHCITDSKCSTIPRPVNASDVTNGAINKQLTGHQLEQSQICTFKIESLMFIYHLLFFIVKTLKNCEHK